MKIKKMILVCLAVLMVFTMCSCAEEKALEITELEGVVEMTLWNCREPYNYHFCLTEDNVLHAVRYKLPKSDEGSYSVMDAKAEYARKTASVTLTEEQAAQIETYIEGLDTVCSEKGKYFDGPYVVLSCEGGEFRYTYGQCLNRNFDKLTSALIGYCALDVKDAAGAPVVPASDGESAE